MTPRDAVKRLRDGAPLVELADAIATLCETPQTTREELMLGLSYGGFVQEQAALALYRRTGRVLPDNRRGLETDASRWCKWLDQSFAVQRKASIAARHRLSKRVQDDGRESAIRIQIEALLILQR